MRRPEHLLLLAWIMLTGFVSFVLFVAWQEGLLSILVATDRSKICVLIGVIYCGATCHSFRRTLYLSTELNRAAAAEELLCHEGIGGLTLTGDRIRATNGAALPGGFVSDYAVDCLRARGHGPNAPQHSSGQDLLELYAGRIASGHEHGWFVVDLMMKLGLLGTIIGFVLMLGSVADSPSIDVGAMQEVLRRMSYGMGTALYTTLAGLVGALFLSVQYHVLDRGLDALVERAAYLTEVHILPRLVAS